MSSVDRVILQAVGMWDKGELSRPEKKSAEQRNLSPWLTLFHVKSRTYKSRLFHGMILNNISPVAQKAYHCWIICPKCTLEKFIQVYFILTNTHLMQLLQQYSPQLCNKPCFWGSSQALALWNNFLQIPPFASSCSDTENGKYFHKIGRISASQTSNLCDKGKLTCGSLTG